MTDTVEVPPMPPGYLFTVVQGRGWRSYGWLVRHGDGSVHVRSGISDPKQASLNAYAHALGVSGSSNEKPDTGAQ